MTVTPDEIAEMVALPEKKTYLPSRDYDANPRPRGSLGVLPLDNRFLDWGSRFAAVGMAWVITQRLLPLPGIAWFIIIYAVCNVAVLAVGTYLIDDSRAVADRVARWFMAAAGLTVFATLASILIFTVKSGWPALHHWNLFSQTMHVTAPDAPYNQGGILQSIVGTLIEIGFAIAITLPLGVGTAIFMNEVGGRFAGLVRTVVEAMTALPSIVAGLFIYSFWILALGQPKSGFSGALAISVMMLPIVARASDVVLRVVPGNLREASLGLGASRWSTVWHVVLPTARPGLATALILAVARGIGETSPVLIASSYAAYMNSNPFSGPMSSLPLSVYINVNLPQHAAVVRASAAAAVLLAIVLVLFVTARIIARPQSAKPRMSARLRLRKAS